MFGADAIRCMRRAGGGVSYRYIRILITKTEGNQAHTSLSELKVFDAEGQSLIGSGSHLASSEENTLPAANAFDGSVATVWMSIYRGGMPQWIGYDFGGPVAAKRVDITTDGFSQSMTMSPSDFAVQGSNDAVEWETLTLESGLIGTYRTTYSYTW